MSIFHGVARFGSNTKGRDLVVGDLHGMHTLLMGELDRIDFDPDRDRLFCVGDVVDRGQESLTCLGLLDEPWFHSVLGNHDLSAFLVAAAGAIPLTEIDYTRLVVQPEPWLANADDTVKQWIAQQVKKMPFVIDIETEDGLVGITHASISISNFHFDSWRDFTDEVGRKVERDEIRNFYSMLWNRDIINHRNGYLPGAAPLEIEGLLHVIHGHVITLFNDFKPYRIGNHFFLDGGAFILDHPSKPDDLSPQLNIVDVTSPDSAL